MLSYIARKSVYPRADIWKLKKNALTRLQTFCQVPRIFRTYPWPFEVKVLFVVGKDRNQARKMLLAACLSAFLWRVYSGISKRSGIATHLLAKYLGCSSVCEQYSSRGMIGNASTSALGWTRLKCVRDGRETFHMTTPCKNTLQSPNLTYWHGL